MNRKFYKNVFTIVILIILFISCGEFGSLSGNIEVIRDEIQGRQSYTITFNANGGSYAPDSQTVKYGGKASQPDDAKMEGMNFPVGIKKLKAKIDGILAI